MGGQTFRSSLHLLRDDSGRQHMQFLVVKLDNGEILFQSFEKQFLLSDLQIAFGDLFEKQGEHLRQIRDFSTALIKLVGRKENGPPHKGKNKYGNTKDLVLNFLWYWVSR